MNIEKFFQRIQLDKPRGVQRNYSSLAKLQQNFMLHIPFENLDMHYSNKTLTVSPEEAYEKIVLRKRGGFCYECNSLLYSVLEHIGYDVELLSARMTLNRPMPSPEWGHMCIRVRLDGISYIVDVGNGQSFRTPLMENGQNETSIPEGFFFRFGPHIEGNTLYYRSLNTGWKTRFHLSPISYSLDHYHQMCEFWQVPNPQLYSSFTIGIYHTTANLLSNFVKGPMASLATPQGRISITRSTFTENANGVITETYLANEHEFFCCLKEKFNLSVR